MNVLTGHCVSSCHSVMVTYFSWIEVLGGWGGGVEEVCGNTRARGEEERDKEEEIFCSFLMADLHLNQTLVMFGEVMVLVVWRGGRELYKFLMILGTTGALKFAVL